MKIVLYATYARQQIEERLREVAGDALVTVDSTSELVNELADARALFLPDFLYDKEVADAVARAPRLERIQLLTAGYNNLSMLGMRDGLTVSNAGDAYSPAVALHAVTMMLALQRQIPAMLRHQAAGKWERSFVPQMSMPEGKLAAIVGFGSIGREIARLLRPLGCRILAVNRKARPSDLADEAASIDDLDAFLPRADLIFLSLPLSAQTEGLLGAATLARCKPSALLLNVARGALVDSDALAAALESGTIAGAGLDVTDPEPLPQGHALWRAPNLIISPHVSGSAGLVGFERLAQLAAANARRFLAGDAPEHTVIP